MSPPKPSVEPLVQVEDLHAYYGKSHILHGVSLSVGRGEVVGLLGRNGVGKSTPLKSIIGLVAARPGRVLFDGPAVTGMPPHNPARIGLAQLPAHRRLFLVAT